MKKIGLIIIVVMMLSISLTACGNKVSSINETIGKIESGEVTQQELDSALEKYHKLNDSEISQITNSELLLKYENVNLEALNKVQAIADSFNLDTLVVDYVDFKDKYDSLNSEEQALIDVDIDVSKLNGIDASKIDKINEEIDSIDDNTAFADVIDINNKYNELTANEKYFIKNYEIVESKAELSDLEKAAVGAVSGIRSCLKNKSSLVLYSVLVANGKDEDGKGYYYVYTKYSATNSFGGSKDDISLQTIDSDFKNPFLGLAKLTGTIEEALYQTSFLSLWFKYEDQAVPVDVDKIMYYLN